MRFMTLNSVGISIVALGVSTIPAQAAPCERLAASFAAKELAEQQPPAQSQSPLAQQVGTIKAVSGDTLTLTPDTGSELTVTVQDTTKIVQVAPGQKDLKSAVAIHLTDLQPGDRILVRSRPAPDAKYAVAVGIIAMKSTDVEAKKAKDRDDWQKRGIGGLVSAVDPAASTVTITMGIGANAKTVAIHTTKNTILRRYAPNSVKFDDAKPAPLDQIKPGDQLRARGAKNEDGSAFQADEIVWGTFRNIAGIITLADAGAKTVTVNDLLTKKPVVVKVTDESQLRKIPPQLAQMIALRLKGAGAGGQGSQNGAQGSAAPQSSGAQPPAGGVAIGGSTPNGGQRSGGGGMGGGGGRPDFQQLVNRLPAATLSDFQKGDAVMVVATQGTDAGGVTAITLLGGIEAILAAAPAGNASQAMTLSPWSLGAPAGAEAGGTQ